MATPNNQQPIGNIGKLARTNLAIRVGEENVRCKLADSFVSESKLDLESRQEYGAMSEFHA
jgi:hypothetical protein